MGQNSERAELIAKIILNHRFDRKGRCMCGKFQNPDPEEIAKHLAEDIDKELNNGYKRVPDM